jgi:hypothetical protein
MNSKQQRTPLSRHKNIFNFYFAEGSLVFAQNVPVARARICRRLWTLRHRFQESIPFEKLILTWTWDMGTSISYLFPNRFQESISHPLTRLQIPAQAADILYKRKKPLQRKTCKRSCFVHFILNLKYFTKIQQLYQWVAVEILSWL